MDILEAYLGDEAHLFTWMDRKYVESEPLCINKSWKPVLRASIEGYPSDTAKIKLRLLILSISGGGQVTSQFGLGSIEINDPEGPKLFNMKVKFAMVAFTDTLVKELNLEGE